MQIYMLQALNPLWNHNEFVYIDDFERGFIPAVFGCRQQAMELRDDIEYGTGRGFKNQSLRGRACWIVAYPAGTEE